MDKNQEKLQYLFEKYFNKTATEEERAEFSELVENPVNRSFVLELMSSGWEKFELENVIEVFTQSEADGMLEKILTEVPSNGKVVSIKKKSSGWWRYAAAAVVLLMAVGLWFVLSKKTPGGQEQTTAIVKKDVEAPKNARAVITLADGTKVYLDSVGNGTLAQQDNVKLVKLDNGQIAYQKASEEISTEVKYNILSNPRGSKVIDMQLSDGSHVWLNAGSSIKYPVAFIGKERNVEITGEAYFEVMHDASKPFHVKKGETDVTVLGTHFNVNAYDDEESLKVTLLEGSVKVSANFANTSAPSAFIKPGQQVEVTRNSQLITRNNIDLDEVMAWKNGMFQFENGDIQTIMREVARWYDVNVVYEGMPAGHYRGKISRKVNISLMLKILEEGGIRFKIEGKTITVIK